MEDGNPHYSSNVAPELVQPSTTGMEEGTRPESRALNRIPEDDAGHGVCSEGTLSETPSTSRAGIAHLEPVAPFARLFAREQFPRENYSEVLPSTSKRILHHVISANYNANNVKLAGELARFNRRRGGFLLVAYHSRELTEVGHYHIVHACSNPIRCRCFDYGFGTVFHRRDFKNHEEIENLTIEHWRNLYLYLEKGHGYR